jgi:cobalt-zinc-cadmium efflux system outer membrane protein
MRFRFVFGVAAVVALTVPVLPVAAQQAPPALTLGDVYRAVDAANPSLRAASASARAGDARVPGASRLPDPTVQLQLMNRELPGLGLSDPLGMTQIQVMQMFPVAGKLGLAGKAAQARADAGHSAAIEVAWEKRADAAMAFFELHRLDETLAISRETLRLLQDLESAVTQMYAVGDARQADVLRAQLESSRMTAEIEEMVGMRSEKAERLNAVLARQAGTPVGATVLPLLPDTLPPLESLVARALLSRGMLRAGASNVLAATQAEQLAAREIWPDLQVGVSYGQRPMTGGGTDRMVSLMLGASVPIWAGSRQRQMRIEATAMRQMAAADLEAMRNETRGRIAATLATLERTRRLHQLYVGTILPQARATERSARSAYQSGTVDFMTLLDALMAVNGYREKLHQFDAEAGVALAELEMLTGTPVIPGDPMVDHVDGGPTP